MKTFDFRRAWVETSLPLFWAMPKAMRRLYDRVQEEYRDVHQNRYLGMDWLDEPPGGPRLEEEMRDADILDLAWASRIVYTYGHWSSYNHSGPHGATWKFSILADQMLAARLGLLPRHLDGGNGWSIRVHEGLLRLCASSPNMWMWKEVAPATPLALEVLRNISKPLTPKESERRSRTAWDRWEQRVYDNIQRITDLAYIRSDDLPKWVVNAGFSVHPLICLDRYMVEEKGTL